MRQEMDSTLFENLIEILNAELNAYEALIEILESKQEIIIQNNVVALQKNIIAEQEHLQEITEFASKRNEITHNLCEKFKMKPAKISLKALIRNANPKESEELMRLREKLTNNLTRITMINKENTYLLNFTLKHIRDLVGMIMGFDKEPESMYNLSGKKVSNDRNSKIFNIKI